MKRRCLLPAVAICLLLCGCNWMDGSYLSITPHQSQSTGTQTKDASAANYLQLRAALEDMIRSGVENALINVAEYRQDQIGEDMENAVYYAQERFPLGSYAVEKISYEIGTGAGQPAISVEISYIHGRSEIRKIKEAGDMEQAKEFLTAALNSCSDQVVIWTEGYDGTDLVQVAEDFMQANPNIVMEMPQIAVGVYPDSGMSRILEVKFSYETSRETLRQMQTQVQRVFASAALYVNSDATQYQKFAQLYNFLMERFDYELQTSITPAYSLLSHGVGDCEAFATVYAAMCRRAGLECNVISGTKNGESWHWNIICEDGVYYHVDLLRCSELGQFRRMNEDDMQGYVWDYSAYGNTQTTPEETSAAENEKINE